MRGWLCETYTAQHGYKCRLNIICRPPSADSRHPNEHRQHSYVTYPCIGKTVNKNVQHPRHVYLAHISPLFAKTFCAYTKLLPPTVHKMLVPYQNTLPFLLHKIALSQAHALVETVSFSCVCLILLHLVSFFCLHSHIQQHSLAPQN